MDSAIIKRILQGYGIAYKAILPPQKGYRNQSYPVVLLDSQMINLMLYKREPGIRQRIQHANQVGDYLAIHGFPARRTYHPQLICLRAGQRRKYGALYTYLPGHTIPWEAYTKAHLKALGAMMSDMHAALTAFPAPVRLPDVAVEYQVIVKRMQRYFADFSVAAAMQQKLGLQVRSGSCEGYNQLLVFCRTLPNQQVLHMDFVRSNILFEDQTITGILDFEKTACGHPLFDIARTFAFLLVDCKYKTKDQVRKAFLTSGYIRRGKQPFKDIRLHQNGQSYSLLESLMGLFLLHDFYKFLRHNPYECLEQNEHFVRTVTALKERGLVWRTNAGDVRIQKNEDKRGSS